jgi:hypothetical protein
VLDAPFLRRPLAVQVLAPLVVRLVLVAHVPAALRAPVALVGRRVELPAPVLVRLAVPVHVPALPVVRVDRSARRRHVAVALSKS